MIAKGISRAAAGCGFAGTLLLILGTYLHPVPQDQNNAAIAFPIYAADRLWITSHLLQLAGIILVLTTLILIAIAPHRAEQATVYYRLGAAGAIACLAAAITLQAVDGIALKRAVTVWYTAPVAKKDAIFYAASAIRQIEVGLASTLSILFGATVTLYGLAMLYDEAFPNWVAALAGLGGIATAIGGIFTAYLGFSDLEMFISMPANSLLIIWILAIGVLNWRTS